jgi:acetyltransferase-like isoleucine patch superfamily enzyme
MNKVLKFVAFIFRRDISILRTIYFNFHYFSYPTAVKFPVILHKSVRLRKTRGKIVLEGPIKTGMVHLGKNTYGFQSKHDYTIWEQLGGTIILENKVLLGQATFIHVGKNAVLKIERNTGFGGNDKIICETSVTIKENTIVAWNVQIIDTDFRATINTITKTRNCSRKAIVIGKNNWLCFDCSILKGSITPDYCIVGAGSIINKDFSDAGENVVIGNENNVKVIAKYITWDKELS